MEQIPDCLAQRKAAEELASAKKEMEALKRKFAQDIAQGDVFEPENPSTWHSCT
jgi:hypothetical protein